MASKRQLEHEGIALAEAWERIQAALGGRYVVSYNQGWDVQQLKTAVAPCIGASHGDWG